MKLSELKILCENISPGPWSAIADRLYGDYNNAFLIAENVRGDNNKAFIICARNHIEELIERVEKLSSALNSILAYDDVTLAHLRELIERVERLSQAMDIIRDDQRINNLYVLHNAELIAHKTLQKFGPDIPLGSDPLI